MKSIVAVFACIAMSIAISGCTSAPEPEPLASSGTSSQSATSTPFSLQQYQDDSWERVTSRFPSAVRPEVSFERFVTLDDWPVARAECLSEQGFAVEVGENGGLSGRVATEQEEAFAIARYVCDVRFPSDPKFTAPLDDAQLTLLYTYFTTDLVPCLEAEGYELQQPPSLSVFKDSYYSDQNWSPYNDVMAVLGDRSFNEIDAKCPQLPGNLYG